MTIHQYLGETLPEICRRKGPASSSAVVRAFASGPQGKIRRWRVMRGRGGRAFWRRLLLVHGQHWKRGRNAVGFWCFRTKNGLFEVTIALYSRRTILAAASHNPHKIALFARLVRLSDSSGL